MNKDELLAELHAGLSTRANVESVASLLIELGVEEDASKAWDDKREARRLQSRPTYRAIARWHYTYTDYDEDPLAPWEYELLGRPVPEVAPKPPRPLSAYELQAYADNKEHYDLEYDAAYELATTIDSSNQLTLREFWEKDQELRSGRPVSLKSMAENTRFGGRGKFHAAPDLTRAGTAAYTAVAAVLPAAALPVSPDWTDPAAISSWVQSSWTALGVTASPEPLRSPKGRKKARYWGSEPRGSRGSRRGSVPNSQLPSAPEIRELFPAVSVSAYRRATTALAHLEKRNAISREALALRSCEQFGKSRLANTISLEDFSADIPTAAFTAYYTARLGRATIFTSSSQARPMDDIAEELLRQAQASPTYRPDVVARVLTRQSIVKELSEEQLGELLGLYHGALATAAGLLERQWKPNRAKTRMVVQRGDDSTSWNMASRAFNQARTGWLSLMKSAGLAAAAAAACPGKVPALVAGDVAYWHESEGGNVHKDIEVWALLPLPWEVLDGRAACTFEDIEKACAAAGLKAAETGWTEPYRQDGIEESKFTPNLVHGIEVSSPELANVLRKAGWFSGQGVKKAPVGRVASLF